MLRLARRSSAITALLVAGLFAAAPAMAADPSPSATAPAPSATAPAGPTGYACLDQKAGYEVSGPCQLTVSVQAICKLDAPYLSYQVVAAGTPNTTASLIWGDENGTNVTMSDLPLSGTVLWPGTVVDPAGNATDWPGWTKLPDGTWQKGDQWDWVRDGAVPLTFHVNPTATITAQYPSAAMPCANPPTSEVLADDDASAVLAETGSNDLTPLGLAAGGLVLLGALALGARAALRRRSATR
ncbi:MAG TPA: peptidase [Cellulomonas sp.]